METEKPARWRALGALLRPDAARWGVVALVIALGATLAVIAPLVVRRIIDEASDGTTAARVTQLAFVYLAIAVAMQAIAVLVAWLATTAAWHTTNQFRMDMARHVLGLDHEFHRSHTPGELIQRVDGDVTSVSEFLGIVLPKAAAAVMTVLGMGVVLAILDWRLAIGMGVYLGLATTVLVRSRHRAVTESSDEMGAFARLYGGIEERLTASEDLRSNGAANHASWRFIEDSSHALESSVRRERAFLVMWWLVQMSLAAGWVLVLVLGAALVSVDAITIGTAFLLFQYVLLMSRPLEEVVHQLETVQKANGAMNRVAEILAVQATILDHGTITPPAGALSVTCERVDFDYGDDLPVLVDIDLEIEPGRSVGIVGRTGSGKTTLSRLVLRLVEPGAGIVRIGGVPITDIPLSELRERVALVPQEVELFAGSIRDNVTLFDPGPSDAAVIDSLHRVGLDALAAGDIHRQLAAGGVGLSAGEAQLLALARVLLRDPDLLVLDEATARVDPETERRLEAAIAELLEGRTALVIAHRLSTLQRVDEIVVFDHGRIVEHGDRDVLVGDDASRFNRLLTLSLEIEETVSTTAGDGR
ncbi:MAG: ABC transporter ATP-binding protein [Acidimicrobiia bacterium]|nr:ABC transporter ATP-binding protein [Acidimicrobiia bacterium]